MTADPDGRKAAFVLAVEHIDVVSLHEMVKSEESSWRNIVGRFPISAQLLDKAVCTLKYPTLTLLKTSLVFSYLNSYEAS